MRVAVWTAGLLLAPAAAAAQDAIPPAGSTAPADAVGPRELQNFSLSGTVTRPADQPPAQPAPVARPSRRGAAEEAPPRAALVPTIASKTHGAETRSVRRVASEPKQQAEAQLQQLTPAPAGLAALPATAVAAPAFPPTESGSATLTRVHGFPVLPWLLAVIALAAGAAFLFWRNRAGLSLAGGPQTDLFSAEAEPVPAPAPPPPRPQAASSGIVQPAPEPQPLGIVATTLRPWLEVAMQPLRCIVTDETVTVEFELDLFNSGSAPARDIHVAAALVNAGETQEQALASFFGQSPGPGERIEIVQPLKRVTFTTQIVTSRRQVQVLEMGGRQVFVPVLAFNANYNWGAKKGQTCVSYLLGRDGQGEKLAPFRLDLGPRLFRKVGARPLPIGVRA